MAAAKVDAGCATQNGRTKENKSTKTVARRTKKDADSDKLVTAAPNNGDDCDMCVDCGNAVLTSQQGLKCDACGYWHHTICEKVTDEVAHSPIIALVSKDINSDNVISIRVLQRKLTSHSYLESMTKFVHIRS